MQWLLEKEPVGVALFALFLTAIHYQVCKNKQTKNSFKVCILIRDHAWPWETSEGMQEENKYSAEMHSQCKNALFLDLIDIASIVLMPYL